MALRAAALERPSELHRSGSTPKAFTSRRLNVATRFFGVTSRQNFAQYTS